MVLMTLIVLLAEACQRVDDAACVSSAVKAEPDLGGWSVQIPSSRFAYTCTDRGRRLCDKEGVKRRGQQLFWSKATAALVMLVLLPGDVQL